MNKSWKKQSKGFFAWAYMILEKPYQRVCLWVKDLEVQLIKKFLCLCLWFQLESWIKNYSFRCSDMQKFPLRMKDNDLLVTELYRDPNGDKVTALSVYLTPKTSKAWNNVRNNKNLSYLRHFNLKFNVNYIFFSICFEFLLQIWIRKDMTSWHVHQVKYKCFVFILYLLLKITLLQEFMVSA